MDALVYSIAVDSGYRRTLLLLYCAATLPVVLVALSLLVNQVDIDRHFQD